MSNHQTPNDDGNARTKAPLLNEAVDRALVRTQNATNASAKEIFCAGLATAVIGLGVLNVSSGPTLMAAIGCVLVAVGVTSMIALDGKL